jgi:hypothetical protein
VGANANGAAANARIRRSIVECAMRFHSSRPATFGGYFFLLGFVGVAGMACAAGCSSSSTTSNNEEGGTEAGGGGTDGGGTDSSHPPDSSSSGGDSATCSKHLGAGFAQAVVSQGASDMLTGAANARSQAMVLDENDDPIIAYSSLDSPDSYSLNFVRWDPCAGAFTAPELVDTIHGGATIDVSIAYDKSTKEIGIAYVKNDTDNGWADYYTEIWLATQKAPAKSWSLQQLSIGSTDFNGTGSPTIAMGGGQTYIAFWDGPYDTTLPNGVSLFLFLSSTTTPGPQAGTLAPIGDPDAGTVDTSLPTDPLAGPGGPDGGAPAHYFTYSAIPFPGDDRGDPGYVFPLRNTASISVALDSTGAPGVAMYEDDSNNVSYGRRTLFWRPGQNPTSLYSFAIDDETDINLAFDGTKALIAGHMDQATMDTTDDNLAFTESTDGTTWTTPVHLPNNSASQSTAFCSALASDGMGAVSVASDINSGFGNGMDCGANPYIATASDADGGGAWTACGADTSKVHGYSVGSISLSYGASRLQRKRVSSFVAGGTDADAGADQVGVVVWQEP